MTTHLTRRGILKALGIGAVALAAEPILEPARKLWFVGSNAPVGSRIEQFDAVTARTWSMKIQLSEEALEDERFNDTLRAARALKKSLHREMASDLEALYTGAMAPGKSSRMIEEPERQARQRHQYTSDLEVWNHAAGRYEEPVWRIESIDHAQDSAHVNLRVTQQFAERDMDLADRYAQQIRAAAPSIREALLKGRWYVQG